MTTKPAVLTIPINRLWAHMPYFSGFTAGQGLPRCNGVMMDRVAAEESPSHKQLIPYVAVRTSQGGSGKYLIYARKGGEEGRLSNKLSLGFGGHVHASDVPGEIRFPSDHVPASCVYNMVHNAALRELGEELKWPVGVRPMRLTQIGFLNDDSDDVGKVHLGIVYLIDVGNLELEPAENAGGVYVDRLAPQYFSTLSADVGTFESWSRLLGEALQRIGFNHDFPPSPWAPPVCDLCGLWSAVVSRVLTYADGTVQLTERPHRLACPACISGVEGTLFRAVDFAERNAQ